MKKLRLSYAMVLRVMLPFLGGVCLLTGCSENEPQIQPFKDDIAVSIRIVTGDSGTTRAVDEEGTLEESYIDPENLKILIFDKDEKLYDVIYDNGEVSGGTSLTMVVPGEYLLKTKLDPSKYTGTSEFAIVALANWKSSEADDRLTNNWNGFQLNKEEIGKVSITDLKGMVLTLNPHVGVNQPESWMPDRKAKKGIPMFGSRYTTLRGYDHAIFNEQNPMPVPDVQLVRAVAKIEIIDNAQNDGGEITGIELTHRNQSGRLMQDYIYTGFTQNVTSTSLPANSGYTNYSLPFHKKDNVYTVYLPEMSLDNRQAIRVNLKWNNDVTGQKWIYLAPYDENGSPMLNGSYGSDWDAIKRNYIYQYSINSLAAELNVDIVIIAPENRVIDVPPFN